MAWAKGITVHHKISLSKSAQFYVHVNTHPQCKNSTLLFALFYYFGGVRALIGATVLACGIGIPCVVGIRREPEADKTKAAKNSCTDVVSVFATIQ